VEKKCPTCGHKHCYHENIKTSEIIAVDDQGRVIYKDGQPRIFTRKDCAEPKCGQWLSDTVAH